jgi:hypothetical protein
VRDDQSIVPEDSPETVESLLREVELLREAVRLLAIQVRELSERAGR